MIDKVLQRLWYGGSLWAVLLLPLSLIFWIVSALRRTFFRIGLFKSYRVAKPVIVIGNLSVGGTGKTPLVTWLAEALTQRGYRPGVITRGYGGKATEWPRRVGIDSDPVAVGDEAVLLAHRAPIVVAGPDRVKAAERAIELGADILISDDGLQHYRLSRDVEIIVMDAMRRVGNGWLLPAGPLREGAWRMFSVDAVVMNRRSSSAVVAPTAFPITACMTTRIESAYSLRQNERRLLTSFNSSPVHAVAGIGNPEAFFAALRSTGLKILEHALPDHAVILASDLSFADTLPVLMTEKDAVKCRLIADDRCWVVPMEVTIDRSNDLVSRILGKLDTTLTPDHSS